MRFAVVVAFAVTASLAACREQRSSPGSNEAGAALALPPEVQSQPAVCTLKTDLFRPLADLSIRASGTTPPYATVAGRARGTFSGVGRRELRADLGIPSDEDMPFSLRIYGGTFDLRGLAERTVPIHAGMPLALGSFAAALPHTELKVVKATAVEVEVEAQPGASIEVLTGPLRARGPCGLYAFERRDFPPTSVIPGVQWKDEPDALLKRGKKIALSTLPIGEAVARIEVRPGDNPAVVVFEKQHGRAHIGWFGSSLLVHGWISDSELLPLAKDAKDGKAKGDDGGVAQMPAEPTAPATAPAPTASAAAAAGKRLVCPEAVPLVALSGASRTTVGTLREGGEFEVISRDKDRGWAEVRPSMALVTFDAGTHFVVRESDLARCTPPKPPRSK
jgi:hypothetical protein